MNLSAEEYANVMADYRAGVAQVYENARTDVYWLLLNGAGHFHFADGTLYSPILGGSLSASRAHNIVNAYTLTFFEQYLNGVTSPLLEGEIARYPEVTFNMRQS